MLARDGNFNILNKLQHCNQARTKKTNEYSLKIVWKMHQNDRNCFSGDKGNKVNETSFIRWNYESVIHGLLTALILHIYTVFNPWPIFKWTVKITIWTVNEIARETKRRMKKKDENCIRFFSPQCNGIPDHTIVI